MNKLLIITYYWPPSGGAGVQRWVKLSKYLAEQGVQIHVLTVDPKYASYMQIDDSLIDDINKHIIIHRTKSFEPVNWYAKLVGKEKVPTAGFGNVDTSTFKMKVLNFIRSNLFIPDPRKGWKKFAVKEALKIIDKYQIKNVISSTPPHSGQLIGLKLKKNRDINWIADLRDPWTDIYYYPILQHSIISRWIDKRLERKVLEQSDQIITVSSHLKRLFLLKSDRIKPEKISLLPNGFDPADFKNLKRNDNGHFNIVYTGTMTDQYKPDNFILALADFIHNSEVEDIRFNVTGKITRQIKNKIQAMKLEPFFTHNPPVPHSMINQVQKNAQMLLLLIPDVPFAETISTGKIYEYLASGNQILCLGPTEGDAATIISSCEAGNTYKHDDFKGIKNFIIQQYLKFKENTLVENTHPTINHYNRQKQAEELYALLFNS